MATSKRIARELVEELTPRVQCSFCAHVKPCVMSEDRDEVAICEGCADDAICAFLNAGREQRRAKGR